MKTLYHPAAERGHANFGWLDSHHSFSFGQWHKAEKMHFGALRVLNDDMVKGGAGFGTHPHDLSQTDPPRNPVRFLKACKY